MAVLLLASGCSLPMAAAPAPASRAAAAALSQPVDISGNWEADAPLDWVDPAKDEIPLTPEYAARLKAWRRASDSGHPVADSVARCEAFGMPRFMSFGFIEILQTPGRVTLISEILHEVRRIYLDGRQMPVDFEPGYSGYSTGHWVQDTLIVSTAGLQANTLDQYGIPHSGELRITERIRLRGRNKLENIVTLTDPLAYTKPWTIVRTYSRAPVDIEMQEYICNTNNAAMKQE
jgi:hypothetical protein